MPDVNDAVRAEIGVHDADATLTQVADRWVFTLTRELRHSSERVWPYLTEPHLLGRWSPVVPDRALTALGPATSCETPDADGVDAEVLVADPPCELVHRWGTHLLRWTLARTASGSRLTLEHTFDEQSQLGGYGAGWHICLAVLVCVLDGLEVERVVGNRANDYGWSELSDRYAANVRAAPSGAPR